MIPTNLITGFLGVGKTTAIMHLLSQAPASEYWAVLVNEFGEVGIDGAMIQSSAPASVAVREVAGGCICCSAGLTMQVTLARLLREKKPDRLIIEPTGLGHPAGIIDSLRKTPLANDIELRSTLCLVDPREFSEERVQRSEVYLDQLNLADVLVITKTDLAQPRQIQTFIDFAQTLYPAKTLIAQTHNGHILAEWLDLTRSGQRKAQFPMAHAHTLQKAPFSSLPKVITQHKEDSQLCYGRHPSEASGEPSCGWIFPAKTVFSRVRLKRYLGRLCQSGSLQHIRRAKGVIRTGQQWQVFNATCDGVSITPIAWRRDSRLELLSINLVNNTDGPNWDEIEQELNALISKV